MVGAEPAFERYLAFAGMAAGEEIFDADIFVEVFPVNFPVLSR